MLTPLYLVFHRLVLYHLIHGVKLFPTASIKFNDDRECCVESCWDGYPFFSRINNDGLVYLINGCTLSGLGSSHYPLLCVVLAAVGRSLVF